MNTKEFKSLLKQIYDGNISALEPIYTEYYEKMVVTASFILKNETDAQDAAADVILKILKTAMNHENINITNIGAYIKRAVTNAAYDIYNKKKIFPSIDLYDELLIDTRYSQDATTDYIAIKQALNGLAEQDREIAIMYYFYDYKVRTIANDLGMPAGTIKWKLSEIRTKLKGLLQ